MYALSDFDFDLPSELIAQIPLPERAASRLLQVGREQFTDRVFSELIDLLQAGDVLVFNDTRVLNARFLGVKESGGKIEVLVERVIDTVTALYARAATSIAPTFDWWFWLRRTGGIVNTKRFDRTLEWSSPVFVQYVTSLR